MLDLSQIQAQDLTKLQVNNTIRMNPGLSKRISEVTGRTQSGISKWMRRHLTIGRSWSDSINPLVYAVVANVIRENWRHRQLDRIPADLLLQAGVNIQAWRQLHTLRLPPEAPGAAPASWRGFRPPALPPGPREPTTGKPVFPDPEKLPVHQRPRKSRKRTMREARLDDPAVQAAMLARKAVLDILHDQHDIARHPVAFGIAVPAEVPAQYPDYQAKEYYPDTQYSFGTELGLAPLPKAGSLWADCLELSGWRMSIPEPEEEGFFRMGLIQDLKKRRPVRKASRFSDKKPDKE